MLAWLLVQHSLVRGGLEREPDAGGRRRQDDPDRVEPGAGAGGVERAVPEPEGDQRRRRRWRHRGGAPRRQPGRPGARHGQGYGRLRNAVRGLVQEGPRWEAHARRSLRRQQRLRRRRPLRFRRRQQQRRRRPRRAVCCEGDAGVRCGAGGRRGEAEPEPVPGTAVAAAPSAAAPAGARGLLVAAAGGLERPQRQLLLLLPVGVGVARVLVVRLLLLLLPLLRRRRRRRLCRRLAVVLVDGLLCHVARSRRRRHAEACGGGGGAGRGMRVAEERRLQVPSRDHPGCRRLMPSAPARPGLACARAASLAPPCTTRSLSPLRLAAGAGTRASDSDDRPQRRRDGRSCGLATTGVEMR